MKIKVVRQILEWNEDCHKEVQEELREKNVKMINIMGSPGAGKTTFILNLIEELKEKQLRVGVIEGDIEGTIDAKAIQEVGIPVVQLNTQGACHIEAMSIKNIIKEFNLDELDIIIVENIGNLVCPAEFDTGSSKNAMILSIPEGHDKPLKYPLIFSIVDVVLINKIDAIEYFDFDVELVKEYIKKINPNIQVITISAKTGQGIDEWANWIRKEVKAWNN